MTTFYEQKRLQAYDALARRGVLVQLKSVSGEVFDAATGGITTAGTTVTYETYAVLHPTSKTKKADSTGIEKRLWKVFLAALKPDGTVMTEPDGSMTLTVGGLEYEITQVDPLRPGGLDVMYELMVAR